MIATIRTLFRATLSRQRVRGILLCGLLSLAFCRVAVATDDTYLNDATVSYPGTVLNPPQVDATNFINTGTFIINFQNFTAQNEFYETWNTFNYTNTGEMSANTGFRFDRQTTAGPRLMAGSFFNEGSISCASLSDTNFGFFGFIFGAGQMLVSATNIVNPGLVTSGLEGLVQFSGQHVDLTRSVIDTEGFGQFTQFFNLNLGAFGLYSTKGLDTNGDWNPVSQLTPFSAAPSFPVSFLTGSPIGVGFPTVPMATTPYSDLSGTSSNRIYRYVFVNNPDTNVTVNVYLGNAGISGFDSGFATVEWIGSYVDSATGDTLKNYLYLNNNYLRGDSTNVVFINGVLDNFSFLESPVQLAIGGAASPSFIPLQPDSVVSNSYAYADVQLSASTVSTNDAQNSNHSITNLPGRVQINATHDLNLGLAQITGLNYMSLAATNQFDGSDGAYIAAPFADINVGTTNGFITVSNIMLASVPNWGGYVQAWSARWLVLGTNNIGTGTNIVNVTITNDYRVLIVSGQITPTSPSQVQDLTVRGTNSVVISDALNIMRKLSINAQNLTLTTNGIGNGATSPEGELNLSSSGILWASALPKVRNLTNNGAIRTMNLAEFNGTAVVPVINPGTPAIAASNTLSQSSAGNVSPTDTVTIGTNIYSFVNTLSSQANQIKLATTFDGSMSNLIAAINHGAGSGTNYSTGTKTNLQVMALPLAGHAFTVAAKAPGTNGNSIVTAEMSARLSWSVGATNTLFGGAEAISPTVTFVSQPVPYNAFINHGILSNGGGSSIWAANFTSDGPISSGLNNFTLRSVTTTLTNGSITAGGEVAITTGSLVTSNLALQAGRSLTLRATNLLTDTGVTNGNIWSVGSPTGAGGNGFSVTLRPLVGDLLGTTISAFAPPPNQLVNHIWAGQDLGAITDGYTNNIALGRLFLDAFAGFSSQQGTFHFAGATTNCALYVDYIELHDAATNTDLNGNYRAFDFTTNANSPNLIIYYAQAVVDGVSVASKMNHKNGDHLRWVPQYVGYFSSTNIINPDGSTNTVNAAVAQSRDIDSDGDGISNPDDSTPFFTSSQVNFTITVTNLPPSSVRLQWTTVPNATNYVYFATNMTSPVWLPMTNYGNYYWGTNVAVTNAAHVNWFASPQLYPATATNVWLFDPLTVAPRYYRVMVQPWSTYPY